MTSTTTRDDNERHASTSEAAVVAPIALGADEGEALWFLAASPRSRLRANPPLDALL